MKPNVAASIVSTWHALTEAELRKNLKLTPEGLDSPEAGKRLKEHGPNRLPSKPPPTLMMIVLSQFRSPLIYILLVAAVVSLAMGEITDALFILVVILLNAAIGTGQEWKAEKSALALQQLLRITARVIRGGQEFNIPAEELVPGDLVRLESGNRVPADIRLLQTSNLSIDESILTGESVASEKKADPISGDKPLSERKNMAYAGTTVSIGRGRGIVVATGAQTEVGHIANAVSVSAATKTPLVQRMEKFATQISYIILGACVILAAILLMKGNSLQDVFILSVALAVAAIPEGLPVALTIVLSIASTRMAKRNVIVRRLTAVESLGSCTVIASDKTGTLTVNQQTVKLIHLPCGERYRVSGQGYSGQGEVTLSNGDDNDDSAITPQSRQRLQRLVKAGIICNESQLRFAGDVWNHQGDPMDVALLALGYKMGFHPETEMQAVETVGEIPFESETKYSARFYRESGNIRVVVKGAAETIVSFCGSMLTDNGLETIDETAIFEVVQGLAANGYRVLAIADGDLDPAKAEGWNEASLENLTLLGLVAFIDPVKPEVRDAVEKCHAAGVAVSMVTGDHPITALAIAREIGIAEDEEWVVSGESMEPLRMINGRAVPAKVYARVSPLQKQQIVGSLVDAGHFVAVTGDGVNDAPALRKANIGVAMGSGTDVAKDVASIIVTDDNFTSIVSGIEEGRFAYDNVRKVIYLLVSTGAAELALFILTVMAGLPIPLFAVQLLWLNLVTNGIQHVALAFEGGEPGAMQRPPRRPSEGIFNSLMIQQVALSGLVMGATASLLWYYLLNVVGMDESSARNILLLFMVLLENAHVFNCRSETLSIFRIPFKRNIFLPVAVVAAQLLHIASMHIPFMQNVLRIEPIAFNEWLYVLGLSLGIIAVMEIFKVIRARLVA